MSFKESKLIENVTAVNLPLWAKQCENDGLDDLFLSDYDSAAEYCPSVVH